MNLLPREIDKLAHIYTAGTLAQRRLARGVRLNTVETVSLLSYVLHELIRDGKHTVAELMSIGRFIVSLTPLQRRRTVIWRAELRRAGNAD